MMHFCAEFEELFAVVVVMLDDSGSLVQANRGFQRVFAESRGVPGLVCPAGTEVARFFIQPDFAALAALPASEGGLVYQGLMTVGDRDSKTRTLRGRVWRLPDGLRVIAEYDIEEMERVAQSFMDLGWQALQSESEVGRKNWRMRQREASIVEETLKDALTGAGNRRQLEQSLPVEISRARRTGAPLSAFMADLDFFKRVNDAHGHPAGDRVLTRFADLMREQLRATDILVRYGGEEFVVMMPGTAITEGILTAERIRVSLAAEVIPPLPAAVTASFGVVQLQPEEDATSFIERMDRALYQAKHSGRNKVVGGMPGPI